MCVSSAIPLTSPTANSHACRHRPRGSSTRDRLAPARSQAEPTGSLRGRRPIATITCSPLTTLPSSSVSHDQAASRRLSALTSRRSVTPRSRSASATCGRARTAPRAGARGRPPRRASPAHRATGTPAWLAADGPASEDHRLSGTCLVVVASMLVLRADLGEPVDRRHRAVVPLARTTARRASSVSPPTTTRRSPSAVLPAHERDAALVEPRHLRAVVEVVDDLVAPARARPARQRPVTASPPRDARTSARTRRGAAAPSRACRPSTSTRRRPSGPPPSRPPARPRPAARPPPRRRGRRRARSRRSSRILLLGPLAAAHSGRSRPMSDVVRGDRLRRREPRRPRLGARALSHARPGWASAFGINATSSGRDQHRGPRLRRRDAPTRPRRHDRDGFGDDGTRRAGGPAASRGWTRRRRAASPRAEAGARRVRDRRRRTATWPRRSLAPEGSVARLATRPRLRSFRGRRAVVSSALRLERAGARPTMEGHTRPGTTGFDVVVPWGWLRAEVPGRPRKTTGKTISAESHEYALAA